MAKKRKWHSPTVRLSLPATSPEAGQPAVIGLSISDVDGDLVSGTLTWGDGSSEAWGAIPPTVLAHTYATAGTFAIAAKVKDSHAMTGSGSASITVMPPTPIPPLPSAPPSPPPTLSAIAGNAQVACSWTTSPGASTYRLERATNAAGPWTSVAQQMGTSFTDTGLTNGTLYFYRVFGTNSFGDSAASNIASATPVGAVPSVPTGLAATAGDGQVGLTWAAASGATSYTVSRSIVNGGPYSVLQSGIAGTSFLDTTVTNGTTYYYVVRAVNASGSSADSTQASATPQIAIPPAPQNLTIIPGDGQLQLQWTIVPTATTYRVKRGLTSGSETFLTSVSANSFHDVGLTNGVRYYYVVSAVNLGGEGPNSAEASEVPVAVIPPPSGLAPHPRIWLTPSLRADLQAKVAASDPTWLAVKAGADAFLAQTPPRQTIIAATNSNPVQFTTSQPLVWNGTIPGYLKGGTGAWAGVDSHPLNGVLVTATGPNTFTVPVNSTAFGSFSGQHIVLFLPGGESSPTTISYGFQGANWYDCFFQCGLAYLLTGNVAYANTALDLLNLLNEFGAVGMVSPITQDSGRADIAVTFGLAVAYDWFFPRLTTAQKNATWLTLNLWNDWTVANAFSIDEPVSNYWEAHQTAVSSTGYATFEENPRAQEWLDWAAANWNDHFAVLFQPPSTTLASGYTHGQGMFYNGMTVLGHNYGGNDISRHVKYMWMVKTATGADVAGGLTYAKLWARALIHELKPDRWKAVSWARWPGTYFGVMLLSEPLLLSHYLDGTTEGTWMQWFYTHMNTTDPPPDELVGRQATLQDQLLFGKSTRPATDYGLTEAPSRFVDGTNATLYWRSGWGQTDDFANIRLSTTNPTLGDIPNDAGHIDLTRGTDWLLVQSSYWKGATGDGSHGTPESNIHASATANTLFFWDGGITAGLGRCFDQSTYYNGCQLGFGVYRAPKQRITSDYAFGENEFATTYDYYQVPTQRTLQYFFRSFIALGNGHYAVWDRVRSTKTSDDKHLRWHLSSASTPVLSGGVVTSVVGTSKITVTPVSPAGAALQLVRNQTEVGGLVNWHLEVANPAGALDLVSLTGIWTGASSATAPAVTALSTIDSNFVGLQIAGATPKVAVFGRTVVDNGDGTFTSGLRTSATFTSTHSGTARYVVTGLESGLYGVTRNGVDLAGFTNISVGDDGTLTFVATAGAFAVQKKTTATTSLSADIVLTGNLNYELVGAPGARLTLQGNGFRIRVPDTTWVGTLTLKYVDVVDLGSATTDAIGGVNLADKAVVGGTVDVQNTTFSRCGATNFFTWNAGLIRWINNTYAADGLVPATGNALTARPAFAETGIGTTQKVFQGNRYFKSWVELGSANWIVGAPQGTAPANTAPYSNFVIGYRGGLKVSGTTCYVSYNYTHPVLDVTPAEPSWSQVANLQELGAGSIAEHNIFHAGHWVTQVITGELRYNVITELHPHSWMRQGSGSMHHNICLTLYPGIDRYDSFNRLPGGDAGLGLFNSGLHMAIYNNTFDCRGFAVSGLLVLVDGAVVDSWRNNVAYKLMLTVATSAVAPFEGITVPSPTRALYLDYNDTFFEATSPRMVVYNIGVSGKSLGDPGYGQHDLGTLNGQGVDPQFRGPLPIGSGQTGFGGPNDSGFPFNDADILNGTYPVSQMLDYFRWIYSPAVGSPLRNAQDPADGAGDRGAVQVSTLPGSAPAIVTTNKKPMVYAGPSFSTTQVNGAKLSGYGADDGLPSGILTFQWTKISGPGTVTFADATKANTTATFSQTGTYVLRLTGNDGALSSTSDCTITVT